MPETRHSYRRYAGSLKQEAILLRRNGMTHREIAKKLGISTSTAHEWTKDFSPSEEQKIAVYDRVVARRWTPERRSAQKEIFKLRLAPYHASRLYTKKDLIKKIEDFYKKNGRIPLKREFNMYRPYRRELGGWNKAVRLAGFATNPELFAYKFYALDDHLCDSFTEKIIDDWLFRHRLDHKRAWSYQGTKMTADFFLEPNVIVEFFGLAGAQRKYDAIILKKRQFCSHFGLRLIEIYPHDIFPINRLSEKLGCLQGNL